MAQMLIVVANPAGVFHRVCSNRGRSVVKQGMLGNARASYWKFLIDAATRYRHAFGTALTFAILGYHFSIW